jgi:hypothetical protein
MPGWLETSRGKLYRQLEAQGAFQLRELTFDDGAYGPFAESRDFTSWTKEGVEWPAEKPWLARRMMDHDAAMVREQLVLLHQIQRANPDLIIVPAHDARVLRRLSQF